MENKEVVEKFKDDLEAYLRTQISEKEKELINLQGNIEGLYSVLTKLQNIQTNKVTIIGG